MSTTSSARKNKKKVVCYVPTSIQLESIKPIEVKCFRDDNDAATETDRETPDTTATMVTVVPERKRPVRAPPKKQSSTTAPNTTSTKPVRHLAILPSADDPSTHEIVGYPTNLSETFTIYDGPTTTPVVGRSVADTAMANHQRRTSDSNVDMPTHGEFNADETYLCNNTTLSSVCELVDQAKLKQKPHSLIGRYQIPPANPSPKSPQSVHVATVHYGETKPAETVNKQILLQQFYSQLEKLKATFNTEQPEALRQITTNTLTFDNGQVKQIIATNDLREKPAVPRVSSATVKQIETKPPVSQKPKLTDKPSAPRIRSAPVTMATRARTEVKRNSIVSCKQHRNVPIPAPAKKPTRTKEKPMRRISSAPPNRIEIRGPEVTLLPHDEQACRQMYEKLQRLQPNGACTDLNTLRRALYPPLGTTAYSATLNQDQPSAVKFYRERANEVPRSWVGTEDNHVPKKETKSAVLALDPKLLLTSDSPDIDRIVDQVKKHAAINYSYYTRTK